MQALSTSPAVCPADVGALRPDPGADRSGPRPAAATGTAPARPWTDVGARKVVVYRETVLSEAGSELPHPVDRASVAVVIRNPWLGTGADEDLFQGAARAAPGLAKLVTDRLVEALDGTDSIEAFGKAAIVGSAGEIEHAGALIHTPFFGNLVREFLDGQSIICFADARGDAGETLVVPMWHKTHAATRSHYQTITARVSDAPRPEEIVVIAAASTGPRPHARIGDRATDPVVTAENLEDVLP